MLVLSKQKAEADWGQGFKVHVVYLQGDPRTLKENWGKRWKRKQVRFNKGISLEHCYQLCTTVENYCLILLQNSEDR